MASTAVAVGLVAWWVIPGLSLPAPLVLGAVVASPDAVSALGIGRRPGLPERIMTILGGESLLDDATALTLFRVFVAGAGSAGVTVFGALGMLLWSTVGGVAIVLAIGRLVYRLRLRLNDPRLASAAVRAGSTTRCSAGCCAGWTSRRRRCSRGEDGCSLGLSRPGSRRSAP